MIAPSVSSRRAIVDRKRFSAFTSVAICLNSGGTLWQTTTLDRFIAFDPASGRLRCEAGVLLRDIQRLFVPRGWMLPVTPGTQLATVGGAIANDVHGKNHHRAGSFGRHVRRIGLLRSDAGGLELSAQDRPELFHATIGGPTIWPMPYAAVSSPGKLSPAEGHTRRASWSA